MQYEITSATKKIHRMKKRIKAIPGGTSAGKTIGILQVLIDKAQKDESPTNSSVTSESFPHLRRGAMKDFLDIMTAQHYFVPTRWNKTESIYTFETGSKIEFFSLDQPHKVRGPRRHRLFMNEANNNPFETFEQLEVRTSDEIFLDWNPTNEFWYYEHLKDKHPDVEELVLTYKDNVALDPAIVRSIESRKKRNMWWKVYGLGELGEVEGKIYKGWKTIDEVPHEARLERYGLDFGYSNDPTAIVAVYYYNGGYILDEIAFQKGLSNKQIADILSNQEKALTVADSAEPKSIDEIKMNGVNITGVKKKSPLLGGGSEGKFVNWSIGVVQDQKISVTKRSTNVIKAYRNYLWQEDKLGKILNEPDHLWSDAMDAVRYAMCSLVPVLQKRDLARQKALQYAHKAVRPSKKNIAI